MADLLEIIQAQLGDDAINNIAKQIGARPDQTSQAVNSALPMIMQALQRNANDQQGAQALDNALSRDHDGSLLDNVNDFIGNFQNGPGAGILRHVLGQKRSGMEEVVSNMSGLNKQSAAQLMEILAPIIMGQLGRQKRQAGLNVNDLIGMLTQTTQKQQKAHPKSTSFVNQLLDKDGDGNITNELTQMGMKALMGGFFRKRR